MSFVLSCSVYTKSNHHSNLPEKYYHSHFWSIFVDVVMTRAIRGVVFVLSLVYYLSLQAEIITPPLASTLAQGPKFFSLYIVCSSILKKVSTRLGHLFPFPDSVKEVTELISIIVITKLIAKLVFALVSVNLVVLFKATNFTATLLWGIASLTPLVLLAFSPILRKFSWYYLIGYFAICGGSVLASVGGFSIGIGLVWKHTVVTPWTAHVFPSVNSKRSPS
jgi:hypothetical protein